MCHVWTLPSLFTQHALLHQSASDGAADVGGKRVAGNTKMDETISAAASAPPVPSLPALSLQYFLIYCIFNLRRIPSAEHLVIWAVLIHFSPL